MKDITINDLPKILKRELLLHLDLVSLVKASEINKEWQQLLNVDFFWQLIYQHPTHYHTLCDGELWKTTLQQACDPKPDINNLLIHYLKHTFDVDVPQNEKVIDFLQKCFSYFLGTEQEIIMGNQRLFTSKYKNYQVCEHYLHPWTATSIIKEITDLLLLLQHYAKAEKLDSECFQLEKSKQPQFFGFNFEKLETSDYKPLVKILLQLRQLEQTFTTVILTYKCGFDFNTNNHLAILTDVRWSHLLTFRGLLATCAHNKTLNPGRNYAEVFISQLSEEMRKKFNSSLAANVSQQQQAYFECLKKWGGEATEKHLLEGFEDYHKYLLLIEDHFLKQLSDKTVLQLALNASTKIRFLFEFPAFVQRLKLILLSEGDKADEILIGLIENKISFSGENLQSKQRSSYEAENFAYGILSHADLTRFLSNEQLFDLAEVAGMKFSKNENGSVVLLSADLIDCLTRNYHVFEIFSEKMDFSTIELVQQPTFAKQMTVERVYQLALTKAKLAILFLEKFVSQFSSNDLEELIERCVKQPKIINICQQELCLQVKPFLSQTETQKLFKWALGGGELALLAADCLYKRKGIEEQLSLEQFIALFNRHNAYSNEPNFLNNTQAPFLLHVLLPLSKKSNLELCAIALDEKKPAIASLAAECLSKKVLDFKEFESVKLIELFDQYRKIFPCPRQVLVLLRNSLGHSFIQDESILLCINDLERHYKNNFFHILAHVNPNLPKRIGDSPNLLMQVAAKYKLRPVQFLKYIIVLTKMAVPETVCALALSDVNNALAILQDQSLASALEPKHLEALQEHYVANKQSTEETTKIAQLIYKNLAQKPIQTLYDLAIGESNLASMAAVCLNAKEDLSSLSGPQRLMLFNRYNQYNTQKSLSDNLKTPFVKQLVPVLQKQKATTLCSFMLTEKQTPLSHLTMACCKDGRFKEIPFEQTLVNLIYQNRNSRVLKAHFSTLIDLPFFAKAYVHFVLQRSFNEIYELLKDNLYASFLMKSQRFLEHLNWEEMRKLVNHPNKLVSEIAQELRLKKEKIEPLMVKFQSEELEKKSQEIENQEKVAENYYKNNQFTECGRIRWWICAAYASLGDLLNAEKWLKEVQKVLKEPPLGIPQIVLLIEKLSVLPAQYQCIREDIKKAIEEGEFHKEVTTCWDNPLKPYLEKCENLKSEHEKLMERKEKVDRTLQKLNKHAEELKKKQNSYINSSPKKSSIYSKRYVAMRNLAQDVQKISDKRYQEDFSDKNTKPFNGETVYTEIEQTIDQHLNGNYVLNLWQAKPTETDIARGNVYLYKEAETYKAVIVNYAWENTQGIPQEIVIDRRMKGAFPLVGELPWKENENVINARDDKSKKFLQVLQSNARIPRNDNHLKNHAGSKQVIYDVLAGLSWILLPFSIPMAIYKGSLFYFRATNGTEEEIARDKQDLKKTMTMG